MKKYILIAAFGFICAKIFIGAFVHLSDSANSIRTRHFNFDKLEEHMRLGQIPDSNRGEAPVTTTALRTVRVADNRMTSLPTLPQVAAAKKPRDLDKAAKDKKEALEKAKERKKRKKKLEEDTAKNADKDKKVTVSNVQITFPQPEQTQDPGVPGPFVPNPHPDNTQGPNGTGAAGAVSPAYRFGGGGSGQPMVNINGWKDALVHRPTTSLMRNFLNIYQKHLITDAQYYSVLSAMQKSTVLQSRQYAVQAANLQPRVESFSILAEESLTETDPKLLQQANADVMLYAQVNHVTILSEALSTGTDANVKLKATDILKQFVQGLLTNHNPGVAQTVLPPFVPILETVAKDPNSPANLVADATSVYQEINALLKTT